MCCDSCCLTRCFYFFFFSSRRRHTRLQGDWSSDVCSSDLPLRYALSFYGLVDLLAILPTYVSLFVPGTQYFLALRILRLLRIFRILKLTAYISEGRVITTALQRSRKKIIVFLVAVFTIVIVVGALMYVIEGEENGF